MPTHIYSFGYRHKTAVPTSDALVIDVRQWLKKNPYHIKALRALRGDHPLVQAEIRQTPGFDESYQFIRDLVADHSGPVFLGCTGGHHRSVFMAILLGQEFNVPVTHLNYEDR